MKREPPLVAVLPRQPGTKEVRYAHLLSGDLKQLDDDFFGGNRDACGRTAHFHNHRANLAARK